MISSNGSVLVGPANSPTTTGPPLLAPFIGQQAVATAATVQSVPADEGFWVGTSATNRMWIQLTGGGESPETVKPGDHVTFTGTIATNPSGFPQRVGLGADEGAEQLVAQGAHIDVPGSALSLNP